LAAEMPARWLILSVRSPSDELQNALAEGLLSLGGTAVEETGDEFRTWVPEPDDADAFVARAQRVLGEIAGETVRVGVEWQEDQDWLSTWRRGLGPRLIGDRLLVTPTWIEPDATDRIVISIDPQMAFGTGEHATTRLMLRLLQETLRPGDRVLDIGTGSGILAIAAARLGANRVDAVENDADAIPNAAANIERNGASTQVSVSLSHVDSEWLAARAGAWDIVVANVLSGVLQPLLEVLRGALRPGGRLLLSGILVDESAAMRNAAGAAGLIVIDERAEEEWWAVMLQPVDDV
jgi:ribosomal protein L11 methyltransferase